MIFRRKYGIRTRTERRRLWIRSLFLAFALLLALPAAWADDLSRTTSYRRMPWHLVDVHWILENDVDDFRELSMSVHFADDPGTGVRLYIAPTGSMKLNGVLMYGGLQTQGRAIPGHVGKQLIFSRWDERRREYVRPVPGGAWASLDTEGDFIGVRSRMEWGRGKYKIVVSKAEYEDGDFPGSWVEYRVCVYDTETCSLVGGLKFPGRILKLGKTVISFVELYGRAIDPDTMPKTRITFGDLRINGAPAALKSATAFYPGDVPPHAIAKHIGEREIAVDIGRPTRKDHLPTNARGTFYDRLITPVAPENRAR